jgi:hypothetical protein
MQFKNKALNLIGQLRIYSLVDLALLLIAVKANTLQLIGVIALHLGFILFLEESHNHNYRISFPKYSWVIVTLLGLYFVHNIPAVLFLVFSFLYVKKNKTFLGRISPLIRGLQSGFLGATIIGFDLYLLFPVIVVMTIRNFAGDLRDLEKDKKEGLKTLPMFLGFKKSYEDIHLIALLITSLIWCFVANLPIYWLIVVYAIEISTYNLTPR